MKRSVFLLSIAALGAAASVDAVGPAALAWSANDIRTAVEQATRYDGFWGPAGALLKSSTRNAVKAMDQPARVELVNAAGPAVKALVMSPAFAKAHEAWIAKQFDAVNHNIPASTAKKDDAEAQMRQVQRQVAAQMAEAYRQMPASLLMPMLDQSIEDWQTTLNGADTAEERSHYKKILRRAKELKALASKDEEGFRKGFALLKSFEAGGPDNEEELNAAGDEATKARQKQAYDQYALRTVLKKRLTAFVTLADSVDFNAPTSTAGGRTRFTNAAQERQSPEWKLLFRFGQAPTKAAAAFAREWAKGL